MEKNDYWEKFEDIPTVKAETSSDPIHPSYYKGRNIEVIDFIEDYELDFCLGNAVKYIARAGKKNPDKYVEDLSKAKYYVERKIAELQKRGEA